MIHEIDLYGMLISPILLWMNIAFIVTGVLCHLIGRFGLYRFIWHKPLFDLALMVIVTGGIVAATPW